MTILSIETSCDETGVALYSGEQGLVAHLLHSQAQLHAEYGGVVPELASRDHVQKTLPLIRELLDRAQMTVADISGIAYTAGPGLVGALLVGAIVARSLAFAWDIPAVAVHHLEGHLMAPMLEADSPAFPFVALLVSGGHTMLVEVKDFGQYRILGDTLDDAVGEAFDKTAKLLGLSYPGGPELEALAKGGDAERFHFPKPMIDRPGLDFSFSGLKTFAANTIRAEQDDPQTRADIAAGFQKAVVDTLVIKCRRALEQTGLDRLVIAGGVGANTRLRQGLHQLAHKKQFKLYFPRIEFCTDNGAMIAYVGYKRLQLGQRADLAVEVYPRWSLEALDGVKS